MVSGLVHDSGEAPFVQCRFGASMPKAGALSPGECEDRWAVSDKGGAAVPFYAAVSDGASDGFMSGEWAELLVREWVGEGNGGIGNWNVLSAKWNQMARAAPLSWHAEARRNKGAFATLLGIALYPPNETDAGSNCAWRATSTGDSVLFLVRENSLFAAFPVSRSGDFSALPSLVGTSPPFFSPETATRGEQAGGTWQPGDDFFLMTDALGAWFLREVEQKRAPWRWLLGLQSAAEFARRVGELRTARGLQNDDVTLVHLHCPVVSAV